MVKKAVELKAGDVIRFEYGDYGNWVQCAVNEIEATGNTVQVKGSRLGRMYELVFSMKEEVEVIRGE